MSEEKTEHEKEMEEAKEEIQALEDDPPEKLEDWPDGKAKYETFGGKEGEHSYAEGPEANLGPDSVRFREDGGVEVGGEEVDNPDEFKGDPIPGGPTDPNAQSNPDAQRLSDEDENGDPDADTSDDTSEDTSSDDEGDGGGGAPGETG